MFDSRYSSKSYNYFFHVIHPFGFSVMLIPFPYFTQKLFCFFCICLLNWFWTFSTKWRINMVIYPISFVFVYPVPVLISFESHLFGQYILIYIPFIYLSDLYAAVFYGSFHFYWISVHVTFCSSFTCIFVLFFCFLLFLLHFSSRFFISVRIPKGDNYFIIE